MGIEGETSKIINFILDIISFNTFGHYNSNWIMKSILDYNLGVIYFEL